MGETLPRQSIPRDFCERFCCASRSGRCLCMTPDRCGWTAERAGAVMEAEKGKLTQSLFSWLRKLKK